MHILIVADGRSPTTRSWIRLCLSQGFQVSHVSTFPCNPAAGLSHFTIIPVVFGRLAGSQVNTRSAALTRQNPRRRLIASLRNLMFPIRYHLGPASTAYYRHDFNAFIRQAQPDLIHALRLPFEGILASHAPPDIPMAVSIWGNDLTLHAYGSNRMHRATRRTLQRANGLAADTFRDIRLGKEWGFDQQKPTLVVPGAGGIDLQAIKQPVEFDGTVIPEKVRAANKLVINPRGFRPGSVRNDTFFSAIPLVLKEMPDVLFTCASMVGQPEAEKWVNQLGIQDNIVLLPFLEQTQLWSLFHKALASITVSEHDGTPNSLLEAMACGCFTIAGNIESMREWITPGENGFLIEPGDHHALAESILEILRNPELRRSAAEKNLAIIRERAEISVIRDKVSLFYQGLANAPRR